MDTQDKHYLLGIDTGGTYTDAAIISIADQAVAASAKALTTRGDLSIGVTEAMRKALIQLGAGERRRISLVSVSTTLATNAVVEGHGSPVCVVLIGFDDSMAQRSGIAHAFPGMPIATVAGGHDHNGAERSPLDEASLRAAIAEHRGKVEAFAIAAQFAVRNPAHEHRARDIIIDATGKPVTVSTELSSALDAPRRALTAALNARLISRIAILIDAVTGAMTELDLACPLMMVKGDGTLALAETVAKRPIETVLSGPAASLVGGRWLSKLDSFIISDIGGTTTDIGILLKGRPRILTEGAEVGGWRTMVRAVDVKTMGLGGDSEVAIGADGQLIIGPQRIVPLSLIAAHHHDVLVSLAAELADPEISSLAGRFILRPAGAKPMVPLQELSAREREILHMVEVRPKPLQRIAASAGAQRAVNSLRRKGLVQLAGFTPSDAAHVLGLQSNWSREAALAGSQLIARFKDMKSASQARAEAFAQEVWSEVVRSSGRGVLDAALGFEARDGGGERLLDSICRGEPTIGLARVAVSPAVPIVAVGAPAKIYYGEVGRRLGAEVVFPQHCDVANAVGAATGVIARSVSVQVSGDGGGVFRVHAPKGTELFASARSALDHARAAASEAARAEAVAMGAKDPQVKVEAVTHMLPGAAGENDLLSAMITAEAIGRPEI